MNMWTKLAALGAVITMNTGCADPATTKKIEELEKKVAALEEQVKSGGGGGAAKTDEAAMALYREANEAFRGGNTAEAKTKLNELMSKHGGTRVAQAGKRLLDQLNVVGKKIDAIEVEEWYVGETTLADGNATLLVFWEVWCPHCKREVPKLQATYDKFNSKGLNMIGLTKLTRGKTKDDVTGFIGEQNVSYPMGKETGKMSEFFGVSGVPAAAVVKDGEVVWRGHPAQINEEMINGWIGG